MVNKDAVKVLDFHVVIDSRTVSRYIIDLTDVAIKVEVYMLNRGMAWLASALAGLMLTGCSDVPWVLTPMQKEARDLLAWQLVWVADISAYFKAYPDAKLVSLNKASLTYVRDEQVAPASLRYLLKSSVSTEDWQRKDGRLHTEEGNGYFNAVIQRDNRIFYGIPISSLMCEYLNAEVLNIGRSSVTPDLFQNPGIKTACVTTTSSMIPVVVSSEYWAAWCSSIVSNENTCKVPPLFKDASLRRDESTVLKLMEPTLTDSYVPVSSREPPDVLVWRITGGGTGFGYSLWTKLD